MKKIFGLIMALITIGFVSCANGNDSSSDSKNDVNGTIINDNNIDYSKKEGYGWYEFSATFDGEKEYYYMFFESSIGELIAFGRNRKFEDYFELGNLKIPYEIKTYQRLKNYIDTTLPKDANIKLERINIIPSWAMFEEGWYSRKVEFINEEEVWQYDTKLYVYTTSDGTITRAGYTDNANRNNREMTKDELKKIVQNRNFYELYCNEERRWSRSKPSWAK